MSMTTRLREMKSSAEALEKKCDSIYEEILSIEPFQGLDLNRKLRKLEAEAQKYFSKAKGFSGLQIQVPPHEKDEVDGLWNDTQLSINSCVSTLTAARSYLEEESFLVAVLGIVKEIGQVLKQSLSLMSTTIKGLLPQGK